MDDGSSGSFDEALNVIFVRSSSLYPGRIDDTALHELFHYGLYLKYPRSILRGFIKDNSPTSEVYKSGFSLEEILAHMSEIFAFYVLQ